MILFQVYSNLASPFDLAQDMLCAAGGLLEIDIFLLREKFTAGT